MLGDTKITKNPNKSSKTNKKSKLSSDKESKHISNKRFSICGPTHAAISNKIFGCSTIITGDNLTFRENISSNEEFTFRCQSDSLINQIKPAKNNDSCNLLNQSTCLSSYKSDYKNSSSNDEEKLALKNKDFPEVSVSISSCSKVNKITNTSSKAGNSRNNFNKSELLMNQDQYSSIDKDTLEEEHSNLSLFVNLNEEGIFYFKDKK